MKRSGWSTLGRRLAALDTRAAAACNAAASRWLVTKEVTRLAAGWLSVGEVGLMVLLGASGRYGSALRMLGAVGTVYVATEALGQLWPRGRPFARSAAVTELVPHAAERSFPSRHVASALAMASIGRRAHPRLGRLMACLGWLLGISRLGAGVHYPSDVLGGALLGTVVGRLFREAPG